jgi:LytS/YehU family sensor histidine kinase
MRALAGTWLNPSAFFALWWCFAGIVPLILAPREPVGLNAMVWLVAASVAFSIGALIGNWGFKTRRIANPPPATDRELLVYGAIVGAGLALSYHARWRERDVAAAQLEAQLSAARLQALKAQLHPHFLFNSLHAVASLIRTGDSAGAVRTIAGLSDLLRRVLDADAKPWSSLREEAGFIERYFDIQRVRFADRLRTSIDLAPGTEDIPVPTMILQPLVENAFRHGLADRVEGGSILVRSSLLPDGRLQMVVEDDGAGLRDGWTMASTNGVGLSATEARLGLIYQGQHEFRVEPRAAGGTVAQVVIPVLTLKAIVVPGAPMARES